MNVKKLLSGPFVLAIMGTLWLTNLCLAGAEPFKDEQISTAERLVEFTPPPMKSTAYSAVWITIRLGRDADPLTLKITNNGSDITDAFEVGHCAHAPCIIPGVLQPAPANPISMSAIRSGFRAE